MKKVLAIIFLVSGFSVCFAVDKAYVGAGGIVKLKFRINGKSSIIARCTATYNFYNYRVITFSDRKKKIFRDQQEYFAGFSINPSIVFTFEI